MNMGFIRIFVSILEHAGRILEEWFRLFETLAIILEERKLILELPRYIRSCKNILEHFTLY